MTREPDTGLGRISTRRRPTKTGKWLTGFGQGLNLGPHYFTYGEPYVPADQAPAQTITFSAFRLNGQVQDSRTFTYAQLMQMVQPAA